MKNIWKLILLLAGVLCLGVFLYITEDSAKDKTTDVKLKEQIGQMLMVGFRGTETSKTNIGQIIKDVKIGGVILFDYDNPSKSFPRNIVNPEQVKKIIVDMQDFSSVPLFISVDAEGGSVNRLKEKYGFLDIASAKEMGERGAEFTASESKKLAVELAGLGFNMNFAPVVDVDINSRNPIIGGLGRSFSSDYRKVTDLAGVFIKEHKKLGIITVEKHFPGHGSSTKDSHLGIVDVTNTYKDEELIPYIELQKNGLLDVVMTAHIINRNIDKNYPATLSSDFIQKILRQQVWFEGVVVSDDMQMNAIADNYGFKEAIIMAINAGCDIVLLSNNGTEEYDKNLSYKARDIIYQAVKDGEISRERIAEAYNKISSLKNKFGIVR